MVLPDDLDQAHRQIRSLHTENEKLKHELAVLRGLRFAASSESSTQLPLFQGNAVKAPAEPSPAVAPKPRKPREAKRLEIPVGRFEERVEVLDVPEAEREGMTRIGEEVTKKLGYTPGVFFVRKIVRPKYAHPKQPEAGVKVQALPAMTIDQGIADATLLAYLCVAKFDDHLPLYRLSEITGRVGLEIPRSTLSDWIIASARWLEPLYERLHHRLLLQDCLQTDETVFPLQQTGRTHPARAWIYIGREPDILLYDFTVTKHGRHARDFLTGWSGYLQADAASTFDALYDPDRPAGRVWEVGCWSHARRKFFDVARRSATELIAHAAVARIKTLFAWEREWSELEPDQRLERRHAMAKPWLDDHRAWLTEQQKDLTPKSPTAKAIAYSLRHWGALTRFLEDGRLVIHNNDAERALRQVAIGRKNWLFAGSERGGRAAAVIYSLIETAKARGHDPQAYLADVLERLPTTLARDIDQLLPHAWKPRA